VALGDGEDPDIFVGNKGRRKKKQKEKKKLNCEDAKI
jgi:hypothetical protein